MSFRQVLFPGAATLAGLVISTFPARADEITLRPVADTSVVSAEPDYNYGGGRTFITGGRPLGGTSRALMRFDLSQLPAGAIITSASLRLTVVDIPTPRVDSVFDLHRLTASWGEGSGADRGGTLAGANEATWNNRFGTTGLPWASPGGDYLSAISASVPITGLVNYTFASTPTLVNDLQDWLNDPSSNFGWLMESESESTARTIRRFAARTDLPRAPLLTIQYTVVPEPAAGSLLILGLAAATWKRRLSG